MAPLLPREAKGWKTPSAARVGVNRSHSSTTDHEGLQYSSIFNTKKQTFMLYRKCFQILWFSFTRENFQEEDYSIVANVPLVNFPYTFKWEAFKSLIRNRSSSAHLSRKIHRQTLLWTAFPGTLLSTEEIVPMNSVNRVFCGLSSITRTLSHVVSSVIFQLFDQHNQYHPPPPSTWLETI